MNIAHISRALARCARSTTLVLAAALASAQAFADVTLAWDPVSDAAGYYIYYGQSPQKYANKVNVGNVTTYTVRGLPEAAVHYFAATVYDAQGNESPLSNEASAANPTGKPVAQFTASATSGTAPLALNLINGSTGSITSYLWSFGDGTTSTLANPTHVYSSPGVYSVSLTASGPGGSHTSTQSNLITVTSSAYSPPTTSTPGPVAKFLADRSSGTPPLDVGFINTSTGWAASYKWTFGDGTTSTEMNPRHRYWTPGKYTVTLTVTSPTGLYNTVVKTNIVEVKRSAPGS